MSRHLDCLKDSYKNISNHSKKSKQKLQSASLLDFYSTEFAAMQ